MREALTVIGFALILAFAALFAAPLYVDWNGWRPEIEARLAARLGAPVRIEGTIDARLLPQPWISLHSVQIGAADALTHLTADNLEGEINLPALLHGDVELSDFVVESPRLSVTADPKGKVSGLFTAAPDAGLSAAFEIRNGSVHYRDETSDLTVEGVHLVGSADSLSGPARVEGGAVYQGVPQMVRLAVGSPDGAGVPFKGSLISADRPVTVDVDGHALLAEGRPTFRGSATLSRPAVNTRGDRAPPEEPWTVRAVLDATSSGLEASHLDIQLGPDERALRLAGQGRAVLAPLPRLEASLTATQLDLDRLAAIPADRRTAPTTVLDRIRASLPGAPGPWPIRLSMAADGVVLGGDLVQSLSADLSTTGQGWRVARLEARLPGQGALKLDGDVAAEADRLFQGQVNLEAGQAAALLGWMQGREQATGAGSRRLTLSSKVVAGRDAVDLSDLNLGIDAASVRGRIGWRRLAAESNVGRIEAALTAERLDLDTLPAMASLLPGGAFAEADVQLSARSLVLAGAEARSVAGRASVSGRTLLLDHVTVDDLGGASVRADGRIDDLAGHPRGEIRASVEGRDLRGLAAALRRSSLPPELLAGLAQRAGDLSPASANLVLSFGDSRRLTLDGRLGGSLATAVVDLTGGEQPGIDASLKLDNPDAVLLLRQIGLAPAPVPGTGHGQVEATLQGPESGARHWSARFRGAGADVAGSGRLTGPLAASEADGELTASLSDLFTPSALFGVALPGALPGDTAELRSGFQAGGGRFALGPATGTMLDTAFAGALSIRPGSPAHVDGHLDFEHLDAARAGSLLSGADLAEPGTKGAVWSAQPFGTPSTAGLTGSLVLKARRLALSPRLPDVEDAVGNLVLDPGVASLDGLTGRLGGGTLSGALKFSRTGPQAALTGSIGLSNVGLATPAFSATVQASVDVQATGNNPDALVGALTGGGTLALQRPMLAKLDRGAIPAVTAAVDGGLAPRLSDVAPALDRALEAGSLTAGDLTSTLSLAGGVARMASATAPAGDAHLTVAGSLDLASLQMRADLSLQPAAPADGLGGPPPMVPVQVSGPLNAPQRTVDAGSLVAWLTIRTAEQQALRLERLEAEQQARDKEMEDQRRAEAEKMQKAIDDQRRAEAAKTDAARQEADRAAAAREEAERIMNGTGAASPLLPPAPGLPATR